jgi:phasin family protein
MPSAHDKMIDARHLDAFASLANATLDGTERLLSLNLQAARSLLSDALTHSKALGETRDLDEALSLNAALSQPLLEKTLWYWRRCYEISAHTQEQLVTTGDAQQSDFNQSMTTFLDRMAQASPVGSELAAVVVKSAIAATSSAFDAAQRVAEPLVEITEASAAAVADATARAVGASTPPGNSADANH